MDTRVLRIFQRLRTGYWVVPAVMCAVAVALAEAALQRKPAGSSAGWVKWLDAPGGEGSRAVLQAIAGSTITVAATVFSITILILSSASQQFGPRMLPIFMRDRWNQFTLGVFTSTFVYSLLVLRGVGSAGDVPRLAVGLAVLLAIAAVGVLILFIHGISMQIQAPNLIASVSRELIEQLETLFPAAIGEEPWLEPARPPAGWEQHAGRVHIKGCGYVEAIDHRRAMRLAASADILIKLEVRPGRYLIDKQLCALVWPCERCTPELVERIAGTVLLGRTRTPMQDPEFAVRQLVEIAARALSPSLNDPFTAAACVEHLGGALAVLAQRPRPSPLRIDRRGIVRIMAEGSGFVELLRLGFEPLRQYGGHHPIVVSHIIDALLLLGGRVSREEDRDAILQELERLRTGVARALAGDPQLEHLQGRISKTIQEISRSDGKAQASSAGHQVEIE